MAPFKRSAEDSTSRPPKKARTAVATTAATPKPTVNPIFSSALVADETDFPRGGGTSLTPLELKETREAGKREAEMEVQAERKSRQQQHKKRDGKKTPTVNEAEKKARDKDAIRVETLNYKRLVPGTKLLARVHSVLSLHLILSLPNQLLAHVPITEISSSLSKMLSKDAEEEEEDDDDGDEDDSDTPELNQLFHPGQYVTGIITATHLGTSSSRAFTSLYPPTETVRLASKLEMSLIPSKVNAGVLKEDLVGADKGWKITGDIKGEEDNGWRVDLGVEGVEGFLEKSKANGKDLVVGQLVDVVITKLGAGGRIAQLDMDRGVIERAMLTSASNVSSVLPGHLVSALITAVVPSGLNVKICGFYDGTIDLTHLGIGDEEVDSVFKIGKKIKARIINDSLASAPKRFSLSVLPHILTLTSPKAGGKDLEEAIPIGSLIEDVEVVRVVKEFGLVCKTTEGAHAFVHISHIKDDGQVVLSPREGAYRVGSKHRARVLAHSPFDGTLLLSLQKSVLEQRFMLVSELKVGEVIKGTIKRLTDKAMFVSLQGSVDGMVSPLHYADIRLKNPEKRFKAGSTVKCRILSIDAEKNRILLTLKKSLVDSKLPIPTSIDDVTLDMITPGTIAKVLDKALLVEVFGGLRVFVPISEASDGYVTDLSEHFFAGKPVNVRVTSIAREQGRLYGSLRQALPGYVAVEAIEIGHIVEGIVTAVHKEQIVLNLEPSQSKALLSMGNEANHRSVALDDLRASLKIGEKLTDLVVLAKSNDTGLFIVGNKPKSGASKPVALPRLTLSSIQPGQILPARIISSNPQGAFLQVARNVKGRLHRTDMVDDFEKQPPQHEVGEVVKCYVVKVDLATSQMDLSTRPSRVNTPGSSEASTIKDREVDAATSLKEGDRVRGFVKSIGSAGLFVTLGRSVTARVQIKEMFDDFVTDWKSRFQINQLVKGKILSVDPVTEQIEMTLRTKPRKKEEAKKAPTTGLADYEVGQKVDTTVRKVEPYGMFLQVVGSRVSGLCHRSELSDDKKADTERALKSYRMGDKVRAQIVSIDPESNKISFGIKPSYFSEGDFAGMDVDEIDDIDSDEHHGVAEVEAEGEDEDQDMESGDEAVEQEEEEDEESEEEVVLHTGTQTATSSTAPTVVPALQVASGFDWNGNAAATDDDDASSESENEATTTTAPSKRRKGKAPQVDHTAELASKAPESSADFERALLGSPNSSYLWVQFMSFQLELSEVDKARQIGRRALESIAYREEEEKLNVWIALLNLENMHGTSQSLDKLFKEAVQYNDAKTVHLRMAAILERTEKPEAAEEIYQKAVKKFSQSSKVWTLFAEFCFHRGEVDVARALLPRSLKSLPARKHAKTIERFAILEFKLGDAERGKTIYEGLIDRYPKELFRWNNYIDQLAKVGDIQGVRGLVDRALTQQHKVHKVKFLFKKLLSVETRIGDVEGQEQAKAKAREWVAKNAQQ